MLVKIGPSNESSDIVDLLVACHDRIRFFIDLAGRLAETTDASPEEVREAAARVVRYFSESLPLHIADEEESILPRLVGRESMLDRTLETMREEHDAHEPQTERLLAICRRVQNAPGELPQVRAELRGIASLLAADFKTHLAQEEAIIVPAIKRFLSDDDRQAMAQELRARRSG
jgi:iron-sulfur cluster repair protein YtfE (RIC family)